MSYIYILDRKYLKIKKYFYTNILEFSNRNKQFDSVVLLYKVRST